jgi:DNA topoisomerase-2
LGWYVLISLEYLNFEGGNRSGECTLILTEGDSAKALAVSGLSVIGRDKFGVFPLKGKMLNVRDASHRQLMDNEEIKNLITILGLNYNKTYDTPDEREELRYGKVMLMTDQDHDGSHIKGLFINLIHHFWPALLESNTFLEEFITPIVKASKGKERKVFFTVPEYENWKNSLGSEECKSWTIKYYKGLGTNTTAEAKEYFSNIDKHRISFKWTPDSPTHIEMAFKKDMAEDRREWLSKFQENTFVDHSQKELSYADFINKELILFSRADNVRSIPSVVDGLKPGQRKILFACFKRKLNNEIKVAQLAGYVSEQTAYHHGEASLHSTIINMAQDFVGANNIPVLFPSGQFGSRLQGGKDAASARYLFTRLADFTRKLFPDPDDALLEYLDDDGQQIQPTYYVPIIPTVLVNGCEGLGTGWSTKIPMYNPIQIIDNLLNKMEDKPLAELVPWARGFQGVIEQKTPTTFSCKGVIEEVDASTLIIQELPLNIWIDPYKEFLDALVRPPKDSKDKVFACNDTSN